MNYERRIEKLVNELDLSAVLVKKPENIMYLSGFTGSEAVLLIGENLRVLITDSRYTEQASYQCPLYEIHEYKVSPLVFIKDILFSKAIKKIGFEDRYMTFNQYNEYREKIKVEMVPIGRTIEAMRRVKDEDEIEIIRKAVKIADMAFEHILDYIKPGVRETEVSAELEYFMKKNGALGPSFNTIVASGSRASLPHGIASEKLIESGDTVTMDFGALYKGYCSDITRTVFVNKPDDEMKKIYYTVLGALELAKETAAAGMKGKQIDILAREYIIKAGFGGYFGHGLGHGVGIEIHEMPRISPHGESVVTDGMVFTIEPGIYISNKGGVRIEDMVAFKDGTADVLTGARREMIIL